MIRRSALMRSLGIVGALVTGAALLTNKRAKLLQRFTSPSARDFHGQNLSGRDFSKQRLAHANFRGANCEEAEFADADLQYADLGQVNFHMAGIAYANCAHAIFDGATLTFARGIETANYQFASFRNTDLSRNGFFGTGGIQNRTKAKHMMDPESGGADMSGAMFDGANCWKTTFSRCALTNASFVGAVCQEADFSFADCRNANFTDCDLRGAKFGGAITAGAIFTNANRGALPSS